MAKEKRAKRPRENENTPKNTRLIEESNKRATEFRKQFKKIAEDADNLLFELGLMLPQDGDNEEPPRDFGLN